MVELYRHTSLLVGLESLTVIIAHLMLYSIKSSSHAIAFHGEKDVNLHARRHTNIPARRRSRVAAFSVGINGRHIAKTRTD